MLHPIAVLSLLFLLVGCGFLEGAGQAAKTPAPILDGKTPIQVLLTSVPAEAAKGNWVDAGVQIALAVGTILAGGFSYSANRNAKRTAKKVNSAAALGAAKG